MSSVVIAAWRARFIDNVRRPIISDAFVVAFRIPNLVRDLFTEGAMSAAFVPTFTKHLALHGKASA